MHHSLAERAILSNLSRKRVSMDTPRFTSKEMLKDLPTATLELIATNMRTIKTALSKLVQDKEPEYAVFSCVPPSAINEMIKRPWLWGGVCMHIFYSADSQKLIVKLPKRPHKIMSRGFDFLIQSETVRQGIRHDLTSIGSETIQESVYAKEPDSAWMPQQQVPRCDDKWPTLVLEVGLSKSLSHLHINMKWWFAHSGGQVKIVIIVSIHQTEPKIMVEKWEFQQHMPHSHNLRSRGPITQNNNPKVPTMVQKITLALQQSTNTITTTRGLLVVSFEKLLLRNHAPYSIQGDFTYNTASLEEGFTKEVWEAQGFLPQPL